MNKFILLLGFIVSCAYTTSAQTSDSTKYKLTFTNKKKGFFLFEGEPVTIRIADEYYNGDWSYVSPDSIEVEGTIVAVSDIEKLSYVSEKKRKQGVGFLIGSFVSLGTSLMLLLYTQNDLTFSFAIIGLVYTPVGLIVAKSLTKPKIFKVKYGWEIALGS